MFPVALRLEDRKVLVVGAGPVALRKVLSLVEEGARVTVVAPEAVNEIEALAGAGRLTLERRAYRRGEAGEGYALVFAATNVRDVNAAVYADGEAANVFVNVADVPDLCSAYLLGRVRRGPLELTIGSGGGAPFLVGRLRTLLEERLGPEWAEWGEAAATFRTEVRARGLTLAAQEAAFTAFFHGTLDERRLTVRVPSAEERRAWLEAAAATLPAAPRGQPAKAPLRAGTESGHEAATGARATGTRLPGLVSLIGAGPGHPGLLTLRGRQRLLEADAVVYDRLAAGALPTDLRADVELHGVGKEAGRHPVPQEQISDLLVRLAREGKRTVRLKGGDPYVFGRGSEEAETLHAAGVSFEVIPGVTSGIAATAAAGIPVTHRREAVQVTLLTAHECAKSEGSQVRWDLLARQSDATIVGYMGVSAIRGVVSRLVAEGMDSGTPAAMVEQGSTSAQRSVVATLATLPDAVERASLSAPALFVIGPTVRHADLLNWAVRRPLAGERLAVPLRATDLQRQLEDAGAEVVAVPLPISPAARVVLGARPLTGCVVTSAAEVELFDEECHGSSDGTAWAGWCLGRDAAARARERGWPRVELVERAGDLVDRVSAARARRAS